jgi:methionyl-tRNA formyltransferase
MKAVVFACQQIGVDFLRFLKIHNNVEIELVITYELALDATYGYESVIKFCNDQNLNVVNPKSVNEGLVDKIISIKPDVIFSIYYRKILPPALIELPVLGCINIHPSMLPFYRGPVPTAWAIQNGEQRFGITVHLMDLGIDTGPILIQELYEILEDETGYELYTRAMKLGARILIDNFEYLVSEKRDPTPQVGVGSYYGKKNGKCIIDWKMSAIDIRNLIRVHAKPFNPAETILFNKYFLINKVSIIDIPNRPLQGAGKIVQVFDNGKFVVSCSDGYLLVEDFEIAPQLNEFDAAIYLKEGNRFE